MNLNGKTVHQVAIPFHFGAAGPLRGNAANNLVAISGEPNVTIMESKALVCNIIPGRLPRGAAFLDWIEHYAPQSGQPPNLHPEQPPPGAPTGGRFSRTHAREGKAQ
jgi:formate dehydrogenase major subunit